MKPTYRVRAWLEDGWWLARVTDASDRADPAPLNAVTQARSLARIKPMGRDLVATILDADVDEFDLQVEYDLPGSAAELVFEAQASRAWLDDAQELWQERSAAAVRMLTEQGYSLREIAVLLELSHQRVDQLLEGPAESGHVPTLLVRSQLPDRDVDVIWAGSDSGNAPEIDVYLLVRGHRTEGTRRAGAEARSRLRERASEFAADVAARVSGGADIPGAAGDGAA